MLLCWWSSLWPSDCCDGHAFRCKNAVAVRALRLHPVFASDVFCCEGVLFLHSKFCWLLANSCMPECISAAPHDWCVCVHVCACAYICVLVCVCVRSMCSNYDRSLPSAIKLLQHLTHDNPYWVTIATPSRFVFRFFRHRSNITGLIRSGITDTSIGPAWHANRHRT